MKYKILVEMELVVQENGGFPIYRDKNTKKLYYCLGNQDTVFNFREIISPQQLRRYREMIKDETGTLG